MIKFSTIEEKDLQNQFKGIKLNVEGIVQYLNTSSICN